MPTKPRIDGKVFGLAGSVEASLTRDGCYEYLRGTPGKLFRWWPGSPNKLFKLRIKMKAARGLRESLDREGFGIDRLDVFMTCGNDACINPAHIQMDYHGRTEPFTTPVPELKPRKTPGEKVHRNLMAELLTELEDEDFEDSLPVHGFSDDGIPW
jgi:hypothetical protein